MLIFSQLWLSIAPEN